jgi:hypothetical protein
VLPFHFSSSSTVAKHRLAANIPWSCYRPASTIASTLVQYISLKNEKANLPIALCLPVKRCIFLFNFTGNNTDAHVVISTKCETHTTTDAAAGGTPTTTPTTK